jgi:hypothetical protein
MLSRRIVKTRTNEHTRIVGGDDAENDTHNGFYRDGGRLRRYALDVVWGGSFRVEYLEFAVALLLFLVMLIGAYWFVIGEPGTREGEQPKKKRRFT